MGHQVAQRRRCHEHKRQERDGGVKWNGQILLDHVLLWLSASARLVDQDGKLEEEPADLELPEEVPKEAEALSELAVW